MLILTFNKVISSRNFHLRFINKICILQNYIYISVKNVDMSFSSWPSNQMCINSIKKNYHKRIKELLEIKFEEQFSEI